MEGGNSRLSRFRTELMGIGSLGVLLVHSLDIAPWPERIRFLIGYGGLGVYMFIFLSGIGLYHSVASRAGKCVIGQFYRRRFSRVLVPYILISGIWYGLKYLVFQFRPGMFLWELSTLSFWMDHKGAWYVALLVPLYLLFPFFCNWMEKKYRGVKTIGLLALTWALMAVMYDRTPSLFQHLNQVMNSLWIFVLGYYYGKKVYEGSQLPELLIWFAAVFLAVKFTPLWKVAFLEGALYSFKGIVILYLASVVLGLLNVEWIRQILGWFGRHSLELYLTNIYLIQAMKYFSLQPSTTGVQGYLVYLLIVGLGILLSAVLAEVEKKAIQVLRKT